MTYVAMRDYDNIRLTGFVRGVPQRTGAILNQFLPDTDVQTSVFRIQVVEEIPGRSRYRAPDTPVRPSGRPASTVRTGELPAFADAILLTENDRRALYERAARGDFDAAVNGAIEGDAARLVQRMRDTQEMARGQVLSTGALTVNENGVVLTASMGVPAANLPGGAASTTATTTWSNTAANILGDIDTLCERARDENNGGDLRWHITSSAAIRNMANNAGIRGALAANGSTPQIATLGGINAVMEMYGYPTVVRYDYKVDNARTIPVDRSVFLPEVSADMFGRTEWGVSMHALELDLEFEDRPGIVGLVTKSPETLQIATTVHAIGMPVLLNPKNLYVFDQTP